MVTREETSQEITLRPVTDDDRDFLLDVYASGREIELAAVPWDDAMKRAFVEHQYSAQDSHYKAEYAGSTHEIILYGSEPAGRIYLHRSPDVIAILDMAVLPQFRKRGIATTLAKRLQAEAASDRRSVRIFLEPFNPAGARCRVLGSNKLPTTAYRDDTTGSHTIESKLPT